MNKYKLNQVLIGTPDSASQKVHSPKGVTPSLPSIEMFSLNKSARWPMKPAMQKHPTDHHKFNIDQFQ